MFICIFVLPNDIVNNNNVQSDPFHVHLSRLLGFLKNDFLYNSKWVLPVTFI